jgi:hypothetical protein
LLSYEGHPLIPRHSQLMKGAARAALTAECQLPAHACRWGNHVQQAAGGLAHARQLQARMV